MGCEDCRPTDMGHASHEYRRALWIVVALNLGMGVVEIIGGFLAHSQALKADALDFLGDGTITLVALIATAWSLKARAQVAMVQGVFLAALGMGVLVNSAYRAFVLVRPEARAMTIFGLAGLVANVISAVVLLRHRKGDAGVVAVWLFSRNDALANVAVILAGLLVAWLRSPLPDLIVAVVIAMLFLHSAWNILKKSREQLGDTRPLET